MKVLISDKASKECRRKLEEFGGIEVVEKTGLDPAALVKEIAGYEALVVRSATKVTREVLQAGRKLKIVGRAGAGVDNIDVKAASELGIVVTNTPGGNSAAVAELALGLMFGLVRSIPRADAAMKQGQWLKKELEGRELGGKTLGLVGIGNVGAIVARLARGIGMKVVAYDPYVTADRARELGTELVALDGLLARSDFISVHVPKTKETAGMVNAALLAKARKGVYLVNCARGGIVVEKDLLAALEGGQVAGAAVDVYDEEPPKDSALARHPKVIATPHIGASTEEAQVVVAVMVADQIGRFLTTGEVRNAVKPA
jgi:D-3-phosphoglycerate dehydrogenase / 2-oxoglutarate reductase